ncbi:MULTISPECIES: hypothetical protein [unclassified Thioalkalivibrio]|uniref:hypothetical protein n=1 Tax=unclassified Thioalkalivibrio TaxID=2621013 RepID=UPI000366336B|nr:MULTISPECIES: hypothetical protein [unclassified Thioalkalivibrio]
MSAHKGFPASDLDWDQVPYFSPWEWPRGEEEGGPLEYQDAGLILLVSEVRQSLPSTHRMDPHPLVGGHWRPSGRSRHSIEGRNPALSDAIDLYMDWAFVWDAWAAFQRHPDVGAVGIYTDQMYSGTEGDRAMLHIDLRPERLLWVGWRPNRNHPLRYVYHHTDPLEFHRLLAYRAKRT